MENSDTLEQFNEFLRVKNLNNSIPNNSIPNTNNIHSMKRVVFNINEIRQFNRGLSCAILEKPLDCVPYLEDAVGQHIGFQGAFGRNTHTPRTIRSTAISTMVCVEGIVTSVSAVRPKLLKSVHYCPTMNMFYEKQYRDNTMISCLPPTNTVYPTRNADGHMLKPEYGPSEYQDFQIINLQEMPENSPTGVLPRDITAVLFDDLVDSVKPGDRVRIYGIYKSFAGGSFPVTFKVMLIVNNVRHVKRNGSEIVYETSVDEQVSNDNIDFNLDSDDLLKGSSIQLIAQSAMRFQAIAPTIYGHDNIKKALALMMVGGNEKIMRNGGRIRGDINMLLVGDPSTAKSQLLRYVANAMPLTVATTGRGSSGVGLTAAVVVDKDTGEKRLEAGAMVIADRGIVCIDEFDKMNEADRVAIHEAMEQQTVTIAKAGIHTTLNARCTVLAAANPVCGSYNDRVSVQENVGLPESLLTRFDLVFITRDRAGVDEDTRISGHVLKMRSVDDDAENVISQPLFRRYIAYAKRLRPVLTRDAAAMIVSQYTAMRQKKNRKDSAVSITPRFLETMVRLSTAHAKLRLSEIVEPQDVEETQRLLETNVQQRKKAGPKKHKVTEPVVSVAQEFRASAREEVLAELWKWKEEHSDKAFIEVSDLATALRFEITVVEEIVEELSAQDLIMYDNGRVYFLD